MLTVHGPNSVPAPLAASRRVTPRRQVNEHPEWVEPARWTSTNALGLQLPGLLPFGILWKGLLALTGWLAVCPSVYHSQALFLKQSVKLRPLTRLTRTSAPSRTAWRQLSPRMDALQEKMPWRCPQAPHDGDMNCNSSHGRGNSFTNPRSQANGAEGLGYCPKCQNHSLHHADHAWAPPVLLGTSPEFY